MSMSSSSRLECAVCLQACVHPVRLPCRHIFCFLCVKGVSYQSKRCPMCRQDFPANFLDQPDLVKETDAAQEQTCIGKTESEPGSTAAASSSTLSSDPASSDPASSDPASSDVGWFYEGRNGWWAYDERTSNEIDDVHARGDKKCELLIAGILYVIDLENMLQFRRNDPNRRRKIKRDLLSVPKKGVAGIRLAVTTPAVDAIVDRLGGLNVDTDSEEEEDGDDGQVPLGSVPAHVTPGTAVPSTSPGASTTPSSASGHSRRRTE